jgi:hypothetical protein
VVAGWWRVRHGRRSPIAGAGPRSPLSGSFGLLLSLLLLYVFPFKFALEMWTDPHTLSSQTVVQTQIRRRSTLATPWVIKLTSSETVRPPVPLLTPSLAQTLSLELERFTLSPHTTSMLNELMNR